MSTKLTEDELLAIIKQNTTELAANRVWAVESNVPLFISTFGLEEGTLKIPVKLVYRLYKRWAKSPLGEESFYKEMALLMPNKQEIEGATCYLLNQSTLKITEDIYRLIKEKPKRKTNHQRKKHFETFLESCIITPGSDWILASDLRTTYLAWCKLKYKKNLLSLKNFEGFCRLYFDCRGQPVEVAVNKKAINAPQKATPKKAKQADQNKSQEK